MAIAADLVDDLVKPSSPDEDDDAVSHRYKQKQMKEDKLKTSMEVLSHTL